MDKQIKSYNEEYYYLNRSRILERAKVQVKCEMCCTVYGKAHHSAHIKTKKHIRLMQEQAN